MLNKIIRLIDAINQTISTMVSWLIALMVLTMFGIVVLRYGFDIGSIAAQ